MRLPACALAAFAAALLCPCAHAETFYVIDQLVIGVSATAEDGGEHIGSLHSGDSVEVLDRRDAYAHVRLPSGTEGWVKASYLSPQLPPRQELAAQALELERLKQEVARLQGTVRAAPLAAPAPAPPDPPAPAVAGAADERAPTLLAFWPWALGAAAVALVSGFALGWRMLDRRIRRKYGGLRIY